MCFPTKYFYANVSRKGKGFSSPSKDEGRKAIRGRRGDELIRWNSAGTSANSITFTEEPIVGQVRCIPSPSRTMTSNGPALVEGSFVWNCKSIPIERVSLNSTYCTWSKEHKFPTRRMRFRRSGWKREPLCTVFYLKTVEFICGKRNHFYKEGIIVAWRASKRFVEISFLSVWCLFRNEQLFLGDWNKYLSWKFCFNFFVNIFVNAKHFFSFFITCCVLRTFLRRDALEFRFILNDTMVFLG